MKTLKKAAKVTQSVFTLVVANEEGSEWEYLCATRARAEKALKDFIKDQCDGDASLVVAVEDDVKAREWNGSEGQELYAWAIVETEVLS